MKTRFSFNRTTRSRELVVSSRGGERLNQAQLSWLQYLDHDNYLRMSYEFDPQTGQCDIMYDVQELVSLKSFVRKYMLTREDLAGMLTDLACAYGCCASGQTHRMWQQSILYDSAFVFVDNEARLRFVFVPFDGLPFAMDNSPLMLLRLLGDVRKVRYEGESDRALAQMLAAFVSNARDTFSFNEYRAFLQQACGVWVEADGTKREGVDAPVHIQQAGARGATVAPISGPGLSAGARTTVGLDVGAGMRAMGAQPEAFRSKETVVVGKPLRFEDESLPEPPAPSRPEAPAGRRMRSSDRGSVPAPAMHYPRKGRPYNSTITEYEGESTYGSFETHMQTQQYVLRRLGSGDTYYLPNAQFVVLGRGSKCQPQLLGNPKLSRQHVRVMLDQDAITLVDLGSTNGTFVGNRRLEAGKSARVGFGEPFALGSEMFAVDVV